jgi:hypothetical protein
LGIKSQKNKEKHNQGDIQAFPSSPFLPLSSTFLRSLNPKKKRKKKNLIFKQGRC